MAELAAFELETDILQDSYRLVDDMPWVAHARQQVRDEAIDTLEQRRLNADGLVESPYLQVDALSTAHEVLSVRDAFGEDSQQYEERREGLVLDCHRLVSEWYRKNTAEYFPPIRHIFDQEKEEFFSHGLSIRQMTENALTPIRNNQEEENRRINERVEDATPHILRSLGKIALGVEKIRTTSECTDKAINDYQEDIRLKRPHRGYDGYVPEIQKVMLRDIWLDTETDDRFEEQIGLPGTYITHDIIKMTYEKRGVAVDHMDKTDLHGAQIIAGDDLLDFVQALDETASEQWCTTIFMGEEVDADHPRDYQAFRDEALERQEGLLDHAETVANFVLDLAEDNFDRKKAPGHVEQFVKNLLLDIAEKDTVAAEQMFTKDTAVKFAQAAYQESVGNIEMASILRQEARTEAPGGGFCGAGSCGLESVNTSGEAGKNLMKKLNAESSDTIVKDTERACRCGSKSIVYAFNKSKVNKYCESCGIFESKVSKAA